MNISPAWLGILRGLGMVIIVPVLTYLGNAANLSAVLNPMTASIIGILALSLEHYIEGKGGGALFGAAHVS